MPNKKQKELSQRQEQILRYVRNFIQEHNYSPSIRNIQEDLDISSTSVVAYNLKGLEERGLLKRQDKISRGIQLPVEKGSTYSIPLLGIITAGTPLPNPEDTSDSTCEMVSVPQDMLGQQTLKNTYALRVRGQSMVDALIDDGDVVLIRYQETANNGDMVAVRLVDENAVTLKKFYHEEERIRLQPANSTMQPIYTTPDNVQINGRVVGVIRFV